MEGNLVLVFKPPSSIHSFEQLGRSFVAHSINSQSHKHISDSLVNIKKREGESLRDYVSYFNATIFEVCNLNQSITMSTLKDGLLKFQFLFFLEKRYPKDFTNASSGKKINQYRGSYGAAWRLP